MCRISLNLNVDAPNSHVNGIYLGFLAKVTNDGKPKSLVNIEYTIFHIYILKRSPRAKTLTFI